MILPRIASGVVIATTALRLLPKGDPHGGDRKSRNSSEKPSRWLTKRERLRTRDCTNAHPWHGRGAGAQPLHVSRPLYARPYARPAQLCPAVSGGSASR